MLLSEMLFKLLFDGFVELDDELEPLSLFFPTKIPTGMAIARMTTIATIAMQMP
jgi:hypothetical protein